MHHLMLKGDFVDVLKSWRDDNWSPELECILLQQRDVVISPTVQMNGMSMQQYVWSPTQQLQLPGPSVVEEG